MVTVSILGAISGAVEHGQTGPVRPDLVNHNSQTMAHSDTVLCATPPQGLIAAQALNEQKVIILYLQPELLVAKTNQIKFLSKFPSI